MGQAKQRGSLEERIVLGMERKLKEERERIRLNQEYELNLTPEEKEKRKMLTSLISLAAMGSIVDPNYNKYK